MPAFILRNLDPVLWAAFRQRCLAEGRAQRWVILELVRRYVERGLDG
jgi:hypothetical protein